MSQYHDTPRRLRLGMVGGGQGAFIGGVHRIAARLDDHYELVAGAFASDPGRSRAAAAELHVAEERAYPDYRTMAEAERRREDGIDVVAIVTPNHLHFDVARTFLEAGIHVICDKPMTTNLEDAQALAALVERSGLFFGLTHNYSGYPLVRQARDMVAAGELGELRVVQVEYPQDWLSTRLEESGVKQAEWRTDPQRSGPAGCLGDIGTHAYHLARFVTGLELESLAADLHTFVEGRALDDNVHMMLRFKGGARGMLWSSQVSPGNENGLRLRVYGSRGGLEWSQEEPNRLLHSPLGEPSRILTRNGPGLGEAALTAARIPPGHPEGYLEAFAQLYGDFAEQIRARQAGRSADALALGTPGVGDGVDGLQFITRALESSQSGGAWVTF
ncbi:Gfo/Idh/MocA family oxidoreductase [Halomonas daqingensis]|uniref:Gfo/Idh/MocA family oxidoreductase n=1 Tax=Billgrantia desiderata TaxID=52021 RepID=A0AAW4YNG4_9GAMM|nr:Gfo/Idh/MocA family oxidoreductase [Halomonas desiderata]MCE8049949.1 Gfo/Idh/MocA family oxidoreductase [Halomonas desiderata]SEG40334.1 Predicted dehydrogenase [Halomonas desiderata]